jgi:tubulin--tyrosine ligase
MRPRFQSSFVKVFVGNGNNCGLVKAVLKQRWWLQICDHATFDRAQIVWTSWFKPKLCQQLSCVNSSTPGEEHSVEHLIRERTLLYCRMEGNKELADKKCLLQNLKEFYKQHGKCVFFEKVFPKTFHITEGRDDLELEAVTEAVALSPDSVWIVKPGENSNRGTGIQVVRG